MNHFSYIKIITYTKYSHIYIRMNKKKYKILKLEGITKYDILSH